MKYFVTLLSDKFFKVTLIRRFEIYTFLFINYMIRLEIGLEIRHRGWSLCAIEDKLPLLLLHCIAAFQEISFVSRP